MIGSIKEIDADFPNRKITADDATYNRGDRCEYTGYKRIGSQVGGRVAPWRKLHGNVRRAQVETCGGNASDHVDQDQQWHGARIAFRHGGEWINEQQQNEHWNRNG